MEKNNEILQIDSIQLLLQKSGDYLENIGFRSLTGDQIKQQLFDLLLESIKRVEYLAILENLFGNNEDLFTSMDEVEEFKSYNIKAKNYDDLYIHTY
ncbi:unnamed protein product [Rhizophagus irregularis]|nr:unnamed protein product [Rhizophagus irregularis]